MGVATPRLFNIEVARGKISGYKHVVIQGQNPAVGKTFEDVWDVSGNFVYPTTGETWEVVSDDANDMLLGTGARKVVISGLDDNYDEQTEIVEMSGTTPKVTVRTDWFRITNVVVIDSGSSQENEGEITIRVSSGGATRSLIRTGLCQTFNGFYTVPAGKTLIVQLSQAVIPKNEDVTLQSRVLIFGTNTFIAGPGLPIYQNSIDLTFTSLPTIPEKTDLRLTAKSTNTTVSVQQLVEGILADGTVLTASTRNM